MDGASRIPGFYPETPGLSRYTPQKVPKNSPNTNHAPPGSVGRAGGPIRRTPAAAMSRARAYSTPYARPPPQHSPGSGRSPRRDQDEDEVSFSLYSRLTQGTDKKDF